MWLVVKGQWRCKECGVQNQSTATQCAVCETLFDSSDEGATKAVADVTGNDIRGVAGMGGGGQEKAPAATDFFALCRSITPTGYNMASGDACPNCPNKRGKLCGTHANVVKRALANSCDDCAGKTLCPLHEEEFGSFLKERND